jgi:hypothetical protein
VCARNLRALFDRALKHCPLSLHCRETQGDGGAKSSLRSQSMSAVDDSAERGREFADAQLFPPPARQILSVKRLLQTTRSTQTAATATFTAMASPVVEVTAVAVTEAQLFSDDNDENMLCAASISTTIADTEATVCCERVAPMSSITRPRLDNDASLYMILKDTTSFDAPAPSTQQCTPIATVAAAAIGLDKQHCGGLSLQEQQQQQQQQQQQPFWPITLERQFVGG